MILYVVRHGESVFNIEGRYGGIIDIPLTPKGLEQAKQLAEKLNEINFEIIITSSLMRARQTAEIINEVFNVPFVVSDEFKERNMGVYGGLTKDEIIEKYPDLWERKCTRQWNDAPTNGETYQQFDERITKGLKNLEDEYPDKSVLLVTHGYVSRVINRHYKNLLFDEMHFFDLENCEIAEYRN
jgi:probable phosphoglycerate mutase